MEMLLVIYQVSEEPKSLRALQGPTENRQGEWVPWINIIIIIIIRDLVFG